MKKIGLIVALACIGVAFASIYGYLKIVSNDQPITVSDLNTNTSSTSISSTSGKYLEFSVVAQEFWYKNQSIETMNRLIDLHEQYNVPLDVIVDDPTFQLYLEQSPELVQRLKNSSVVAVNYHFRPPYPFYTRFDFRGLAKLSASDKEAAIREYFEHAIDLTTGMPTDALGGYAFIKEQMGYAPIMAGMITEAAFGPTLVKLYKEYGAQMLIQHSDYAIPLGTVRDGMPVRPEDYPVILSEHYADTPQDIIDSDWTGSSAAQFKSIKTHDNDFIATSSAWLSIYMSERGTGSKQPPFDLSVHDQYAELLSEQERENRWTQYEALLSYAHSQRDVYTLSNAKTVAAVVTGQSDKAPVTSNDVQPPIYVSLVSHNEEPLSRRYPNFPEDEASFEKHRDQVVAFAQKLYELDVPYSWQSDWAFLTAVQQFDDGTASTNGKNMVQYLSEDLGVEVDAHAHQTRYNYADVNYLIQSLGITPTGVVGGLIVHPVSDSQYDGITKSIQSTLDPSYIWTPKILWGGGSGLHLQDVDASGVWKPKDASHFFEPSEEGALTAVGTYTSDWAGVKALLAERAAGRLRSDVMYTVSVMVDQINIADTDIEDEVYTEIEALADERAQGAIQFVNIQEVVQIWEEEFHSLGFVYMDNSSTTTAPNINTQSTQKLPSTNRNTSSTVQKGACGDGVCTPFEQRSQVCTADCS